MNIDVRSEIGALESVVIHTPGPEVENMTPQDAERALYSDILNLSVAREEYDQFRGVLSKVANVYEVKDLLEEVLKKEYIKENLLNSICDNESVNRIRDHLIELSPHDLARQLIEGVPLIVDNLTSYLSEERYALMPLHNFFFTRDDAVAFRDKVLISRLNSQVREREALIMEAIFTGHPEFRTKTRNPYKDIGDDRITIEGGDLLIARDDIILAGIGARTSSYGIDAILEILKEKKEKFHLIVQELPLEPESFIHLDMVFTFLDKDACMIYEPVVLNRHAYQTVHIKVDNGKVTISERRDIISALAKIGMDVEPLRCGGDNEWTQEREQWHSGTNFFAFAPGKVMGYSRNVNTIEEMNKNGFAVLDAYDVIEGKENPDDHKRCVVTIEGSELSRGGGGCRCMTMPLKRKEVNW